MRQYGTALGFVGLAFSAAECFGESMRGQSLLPRTAVPTSVADILWQHG